MDAALTAARAIEDRPSLIVARTHIGYGSPHKQDTWHAHGEPLGVEEVRLTKRALGWPEDRDFYVPEDALRSFERPSSEAPNSRQRGVAAWTGTESRIPTWLTSLRARSPASSPRVGRHISRFSRRRTARWRHATRGERSSTRWPAS